MKAQIKKREKDARDKDKKFNMKRKEKKNILFDKKQQQKKKTSYDKNSGETFRVTNFKFRGIMKSLQSSSSVPRNPHKQLSL